MHHTERSILIQDPATSLARNAARLLDDLYHLVSTDDPTATTALRKVTAEQLTGILNLAPSGESIDRRRLVLQYINEDFGQVSADFGLSRGRQEALRARTRSTIDGIKIVNPRSTWPQPQPGSPLYFGKPQKE
jgi:hypothetical protein